MFEKVMISVPMEQFPSLAFERARDLSEYLGSELLVSYVIEDDLFKMVSASAVHVVTGKDQELWERKMIRTHEKIARDVVVKEAEKLTGRNDIDLRIVRGGYAGALSRVIEDEGCDMILMEYHSFDLLKYRIMDRSPVPVWIERNKGPIRRIGLFCTNLAPNERAPGAARKLKKAFGAGLESYYILDPEGDADEEREGPDMISARDRIRWTDVVHDRVESFITKRSKENDLDLIILGRIRKRGYFHLRSKFAKKTRASVLLIN